AMARMAWKAIRAMPARKSAASSMGATSTAPWRTSKNPSPRGKAARVWTWGKRLAYGKAMFDAFLRLLSGPQLQAVPDLRLAVAVLLLEAARQDDSFDARERAVIMRLLAARFALSQGECEKLVVAAQGHADELVQLHGHTSAIVAAMSPRERIELI